MSFFHGSFVEGIVDLDCCFLKSFQVDRFVGLRSFSYHLILNVVLKSSIEHGLKGDIVPACLGRVLLKLGNVLRCRGFLRQVLNNPDRLLLTVAKPIDTP